MKPTIVRTTRVFKHAMICLVAALLSVSPLNASAESVPVIEFYNKALDHYFVTANGDEIGKLDTGIFIGWTRTGRSFVGVNSAPLTPGEELSAIIQGIPIARPVCRFYGNPTAGLDSHFYSVSTAECAEVKAKFPDAWVFESDNVFQAYLPNQMTGICPSATTPVYRSWNNRADSNHRYTTDLAVQTAMVAKGYVAEGYGNPPVVMCAPVMTGATAIRLYKKDRPGVPSPGWEETPVPYSASSGLTATGGAASIILETYTLTAKEGGVTVSNVTATDSKGAVMPRFSGLAEGQQIAAGQSVVFDLIAPLTHDGRLVDLRFSFRANGATAFNVQIKLTSF